MYRCPLLMMKAILTYTSIYNPTIRTILTCIHNGLWYNGIKCTPFCNCKKLFSTRNKKRQVENKPSPALRGFFYALFFRKESRGNSISRILFRYFTKRGRSKNFAHCAMASRKDDEKAASLALADRISVTPLPDFRPDLFSPSWPRSRADCPVRRGSNPSLEKNGACSRC